MNLDKLTDEWIKAKQSNPKENDSNFWSISYVINLNAPGKYDELWGFILHAYKKDIPDKILGNLAAGPLEDLLASAGERYIEEVEELARKDPKFRKMLCGVWQNAMSDPLWARVKKASNVS